MIQFDKTQPVNINPRYAFGGGVILRHITGDSWEQVDFGGTHIAYVKAESVDYAPTLAEQFIKGRSYRQ
jgi:hypothetical protein